MNVAKNNEVGIINSGRDCNDKTVKKSLFKKSNRAMNYLTFKVRLIFTQLRKIFTKVLILQYFDPKYYIRIEINAPG